LTACNLLSNRWKPEINSGRFQLLTGGYDLPRTATKVLPPPLSAMAVRIFDDLSNLSLAAFPVAIAEV